MKQPQLPRFTPGIQPCLVLRFENNHVAAMYTVTPTGALVIDDDSLECLPDIAVDNLFTEH